MFAATRRWFRRNRTPIAVGVGLLGAGYLATQYVVGKIKEARERMSSDRIAKENLKRRFEQNQEDCTFTVLALLPTASANILEAMNTERITYEIQQMKGSGGKAGAGTTPAAATTTTGSAQSRSVPGSATPPSIADTTSLADDASIADSGVHASQISLPPVERGEATQQQQAEGTPAPVPAPAPKTPRKTKRQLWDELTISSITRTFTLVYTLGLLTMLTRIQLNLLGRRSYLSSVVSLATGAPQSTISLENRDDGGGGGGDAVEDPYDMDPLSADFETNRRYLTFSWWLLNRGWSPLSRRVEEAVRAAFGHLSPRDALTLDQFAALVRRARQDVEGATPQERAALPGRWLEFILPPQSLEGWVLREARILSDSAEAQVAADDAHQEHQQQHQQQRGAEPDSPTMTDPTPVPFVASPQLRRLLDETADLSESPAFAHVLTQLLDAAFALLVDGKVARAAFGLPPPDEDDQLQNHPMMMASASSVANSSVLLPSVAAGGPLSPPHSAAADDAHAPPPARAVLLPRILSVVARQAHAVGAGGDGLNGATPPPQQEQPAAATPLEVTGGFLPPPLPPPPPPPQQQPQNEYLREMEAVRGLEAFAALVYSSNWDAEVRDGWGSNPTPAPHPPQPPPVHVVPPLAPLEPEPIESEAAAATAPVTTEARDSAPPQIPDKPSRASTAATAVTTTDDSVVVVPSQMSDFESAWDRAQQGGS